MRAGAAEVAVGVEESQSWQAFALCRTSSDDARLETVPGSCGSTANPLDQPQIEFARWLMNEQNDDIVIDLYADWIEILREALRQGGYVYLLAAARRDGVG